MSKKDNLKATQGSRKVAKPLNLGTSDNPENKREDPKPKKGPGRNTVNYGVSIDKGLIEDVRIYSIVSGVKISEIFDSALKAFLEGKISDQDRELVKHLRKRREGR